MRLGVEDYHGDGVVWDSSRASFFVARYEITAIRKQGWNWWRKSLVGHTNKANIRLWDGPPGRTQQPETLLPKEIAAVLDLQTHSGQWRLCKRLYHALGHTAASIPCAPDGVKDGRWATALAVTFLRRRPDLIDLTYDAYSRAIAWVDEPLLAQAHTRLPPADLYYPVEEEASRQGRWQQQAGEALEECGYAYFLPRPFAADDDVEDGDGCGGPRVTRPSSVLAAPESSTNNPAEAIDKVGNLAFPSPTAGVPRLRGAGKRPRIGERKPVTSKTSPRRRNKEPCRKGSAAAAERSLLHQQSNGLQMEVNLAIRLATSTFREGDRVESRWRRPTRLDKPRLDPDAWHVGRVVQSHKDGSRVDVLFEDGDGERLSGIPTKHVRLAPSSSCSRRLLPTKLGGDCNTGAAFPRENHDALSPTPTPVPTHTPKPAELLCSSSRRELAYIESATKSLRRTWEEPLPIGQELERLRMLGEQKMRDRPEWQGSFPLVDFQITKRMSFGECGTVRAGRGATREHRRARHHISNTVQGRVGIQSRRSLSSPASSSSLTIPGTGMAKAKQDQERRGDGGAPVGRKTTEMGRRSFTAADKKGNPCFSSPAPIPLSPPTLDQAQSKLVAAAMAYDRCVTKVKDCLNRGATAFRVARTYSEQQKAFEESTATLGPSQPARAGYTDWRGSPVTGLQSATLNVVEAMDAWAMEWAAARDVGTRSKHAGEIDSNVNGRENIAIEGEEEVLKDGEVAPTAIAAPPFLWEGSPLAATIIDHSANLMAGVPELKGWYGPGFPIARNPFFLTYPLDDRPVTPRNALVRAWVDGEMKMTVSHMLLEEREKEEATLKLIFDKQASAPSWWPTCRAPEGGEAHYERIRRAEKVLAREESQIIKPSETAAKNQESIILPA